MTERAMTERSETVVFGDSKPATTLNLLDVLSEQGDDVKRKQFEDWVKRGVIEAEVGTGRSKDRLDSEAKKKLASWLQDHFGELEGALSKSKLRQFEESQSRASTEQLEEQKEERQQTEQRLKANIEANKGTIGLTDLVHVYGNGQWPDGKPLSDDDKQQFRLAGKYLNRRDPGAPNSATIVEADIFALSRGAVQWTEPGTNRAVTIFPDGTKMVSRDGSKLTEQPNGTLVLDVPALICPRCLDQTKVDS